MERARATWTDERLDDLARRMDAGFDRLDADMRSLRTELSARIDAQGAELGGRIDAVENRLGTRIDAQGQELGGRIDALQRTMLQIGVGMIVALLAAALSVIAAQ